MYFLKKHNDKISGPSSTFFIIKQLNCGRWKPLLTSDWTDAAQEGNDVPFLHDTSMQIEATVKTN